MPRPDRKPVRILLAGGGTGGHLFPALAIADALRKSGLPVDIRFVGSRFGIEARILPEENEIFYPLTIRGIQRGLSLQAIGRNFLFPWRFVATYRLCKAIMKEFRPQVVVGTGGYASGLPLLVAQKHKIPTLLQEQNSFPGITIRKLAPKADLVCLTYKDSADHIDTVRWVLTGNPVRFRHAIPGKSAARRQLGLPQRKQVLFILGGSQGSRPLNNHFLAHWQFYTGDLKVHLLWQTGEHDYDRIVKAVGTGQGVTFKAFIDRMAAAYIAADLVICRAGAMTISELTLLGRPSVLVPFPGAAADHQTLNARALERRRATRLVAQKDLSKGRLEEAVRKLINDSARLNDMAERASSLAEPAAANTIAEHILKLAEV